MILGNFYNETTRKYIVMFGTLFNNVTISRVDNANTELQEFKVPISYGPKQKFLARLDGDAGLDRPQAITLPRMSFEILNMSYAGERQISGQISSTPTSTMTNEFTATPYDIEIELTVMSKYMEDGLRIVEQILPVFRPFWNSSVFLVDGLDESWDVQLFLNSVTPTDTYEGNFEERRVMVWSLNFILKGYFFGPAREKSVIKFVNTNVYNSLDAPANSHNETVHVQPGLDANGNPVTTTASDSIDPTLINFEDNWGVIAEVIPNE